MVKIRARIVPDNRGLEGKISINEGICPICNRFGRLFRDHEHKTKRHRGLICNRCNSGLGMFLDDADLLIRASEYLKLYKLKDILGIK